jgi:hypothetical protein
MRPARAAALVLWSLAAVAAAGWLAVVEVLRLPLRVGGFLLPLSIVAAVVGNLLLTDLCRRASGSRLVATLPVLAWLVVVVAASSRRPEGDLLVTGGGATGVVNLAFLLTGVLAGAFAVGRMLGGPPRAPVRPEPDPDPEPAAGRVGSGSGGAR